MRARVRLLFLLCCIRLCLNGKVNQAVTIFFIILLALKAAYFLPKDDLISLISLREYAVYIKKNRGVHQKN